MNNKCSSFISLQQIGDLLDGIPDIIKIFSSNHKIYFCNKAGYEFYKKNRDEIKGKTCYSLLERKEKCKQCGFDEVIKKKKIFKQERYIPELNKIMDICYSPLFDENGEVNFVIERLRDITEKKMLDKVLKNDKDRYKQIVNNLPDALLIIVDNKIEIANSKALNIFQMSSYELVDSNIYKYFDEKYSKILHKKFKKIILDKKSKDLYDCELNLRENKKISIQLTSSYISYEGKAAICMALTDTSYIKNQLINTKGVR